MMENDCHTVGDYDHSMIEHVRKFPKNRITPSGSMNHFINVLFHTVDSVLLYGLA